MLVHLLTYDLGSVPEWITAVSAFITLVGVALAYFDYKERTRPYTDVELKTNINTESKIWSFSTLILNKGQYPIFSKITKALLVIGDEKYPTIVDSEVVIFPGEDKKIEIPVGNINATGRRKIREAKYTKNVVELEVEVSSRKIREKDYKYKTLLKVQILVEEDQPGFILIEKTFS